MTNYWTTDDIQDQTGKVAIVTGANSGIGYETARILARKGATVILACRNIQKGEFAVSKIRKEFASANIRLMLLDLCDLQSIRWFADKLENDYHQLDILINNAGIMMPPFGKTVDGFEIQFGTNHLGHFALTGLLLKTIVSTPKARVVTVSSLGHRRGKIDFNNLYGQKGYSRKKAYGQSKLANLLFTYELQRRLKAIGVDPIALAVHPGWTLTNLQRYSGLYSVLNHLMAQKPQMGALPTLYAAIAPDVRGGDYIGPGSWHETRGYPIKVQSNPSSHNKVVAGRLWAISEEMTGVIYHALAGHS